MKIKKKCRGWGGREDPVGGQGGCERRIEVIVKMQKKTDGGVQVRWGMGVKGLGLSRKWGLVGRATLG